MSWMLKEIHQQPEALAKFWTKEKKKIDRIAANMRKHNPQFIVLVARGSSDHAALYGKYLLEVHAGIPVVLAAPSVFTVYNKQPDMKNAVVIGISQSGEGPDVMEVMRAAKQQGAYTIGITNSAGSPLATEPHDSIMLSVGKEKGLAATKTYTAELLAFMLLSAAYREDKHFQSEIEAVPEKLAGILDVEIHIALLSERYRYMEHCVMIGRGLDYCTVREAALKMMETSYVVAQPFSTADFLHGPIAIAGTGFPTFVSIPNGAMTSQLHNLCRELIDKQLETIIVTPDTATAKIATKAIHIPVVCDELVSPIFQIIPFQFLACYVSTSKGIDPDQPRFLRKVTKTL